MTRRPPGHLRPGGARRGRPGRERGSAAVELALLAPLLVLLALAVLAAGRQTEARMQVNDAAAAAARAATIARTPTDAVSAARDAVAGMTTGDTAGCQTPTVSLDVSDFVPGGTVTATVQCTVRLGDLTGLGLPGSVTLTASASEVLDKYRAVGLGPFDLPLPDQPAQP
ncbi:pilus assembly protein [Frankia sp. AgB1.9]|uniref:TadE/TadG family type IV pilus assembly protein n=1 Tax=unclassified Frankia TaxID=2632575 RepID=UPI0019331E75|nr:MULTISPECIES: TadE/TadG family type IV pilus assembly protein [unclassified Frankia]MBL7489713.1 pilus assembly protein [Frankia sp. AgW1.1]MBL7551923.1 pilus assembly protein [Frankia sp. AgB1.9]MBL7623238.1 pilus assembly protein [Frankia sp. AgB1.8]